MSKTFNITAAKPIWIGTDQPIQINVTQTDETTPQAMTGWALTWELKARPGSTTVLITKTVGSGITIQNGDGTNDQAEIQIDDVDTEPAAFPTGPGEYYHFLRRTDSGLEKILSEGTVVIKATGLTA